MKLKTLVIVFVWLFWGSFSSAQAQTKPCGCADKEELLNYLNLTQAAIQESKFQLDLITKQERAEGKPVMFSDDGYKKFLETFQNALRAVHKKGVARANVTMNTGDCSLKTSETGNFCVQQAETIRTRIHQKVCMESLLERKAKTESYLDRMEMKQIVREAIAGWEAAQEFTLQMLKSLPKNCRPNGWFGYIVLQRVASGVTVITTPPRPIINGRGLNGGTAEDIQKWTYIGKILVEEGKAKSIRGSAVYSEDSVSTSSEQAFCDSIIGSKTRSHTITFKNSAAGEAEGDVVAASQFTLLKVNPANQTYDLYARNFPRVNTTGQKVHWSKSTGGCSKDQETNRTETYTSSSPESGHSITEKIKPGSSDYLEGSRVVKPAEGNKSSTQGNTSMTITQELHLRWMLRRLPAK